MPTLSTVQKHINERMKKRRPKKMLHICLSPKKAREDVDFIGYLFENKKISITKRAYSQKNNRQAKNHL